MELFFLNDYVVDVVLDKYVDSMLFNPKTEIAHSSFSYGTKTCDISLRVAGEVSIGYKGIIYSKPTDFPSELKKLIKNNDKWWHNEDIYLDINNYFEYVCKDGKRKECTTLEDDLSRMTRTDIINNMIKLAKAFLNFNVETQIGRQRLDRLCKLGLA